MGVSVNLELSQKPTRLGTYPIYVRITKDRKSKRVKTSVALNKVAEWNKEKQKVRSTNPDAIRLNAILKKEKDRAVDTYEANKDASLGAITDSFKHTDSSQSFWDFTQAHTATLLATGASGGKHYKTFQKILGEYLESKGRTDITFSEVCPSFVADFKHYLEQKTKGTSKKEEDADASRLHPNYIRAILVKLRALCNKAIEEGKMKPEKYPFANITISKELPTKKEALTEAELDAFMAVEAEEGSLLWHCKNAFLFSFYCAGIRCGDLLQLKWNNIKEERLEYTMDKNNKKRNLPLMPQALEILKHYKTDSTSAKSFIFPFLSNETQWAKYDASEVETMPVALKTALYKAISSKNVVINHYLEKIAKKAGIDKHITFHISRHSFANYARQKKLHPKLVQEILAHSNLSTTERYMGEFASNEVDDAMQDLFTQPTSKEEMLLAELRKLDKDALQALLAKL